MRLKPSLPVLLIIVCAVAALGATVYFGIQSESATVLPKRAMAAVAVKKTPPAAPLRVWAIAGPEGTASLQQAVAAWQPGFAQRIDLRFFPGRVEYETARILATQDRQLPDVFWVSSDEIDTLDQSQLLAHVPLASVQPGTWLPETLAPFTRGNDLMAYPTQYSVLALYYNRRIFDQVGIAYPDTPWNWETLVSVSRALYKPPQGGKATRFSLEWTPTMELWNAFSAQAGRPLYDGRTWLLGLPDFAAAQREAIQFIIDLQQSYSFNAPSVGAGRPSLFEKGECAMILAGPEYRTVLRALPDLQWGVAPLPDRYALEPDHCTRATPVRLGGWGVWTKSPQAEAALQLAEKLSTVPLDGWLPARRDAVGPGAQESEGSALFAQALGRALPSFSHAQAPRVSQSIDNILVTFRNAPTNPDKFLAKVDIALEDIDLRPPPAPLEKAPAPTPPAP